MEELFIGILVGIGVYATIIWLAPVVEKASQCL